MALPLLGAALGVASYLTRPKGKRPNIQGAIGRYEGAQPNAGDIAFGERRLARTNELIGQGLNESTAGVARRFRARGLGGPAEDQALGNIAQAGAQARVNAGRDVADLIDQRSQRRAANVFNAEVGQTARDQQNYDLQRSGYWNSMLELLPGLAGAGGRGAASGSAGFIGPPDPTYDNAATRDLSYENL